MPERDPRPVLAVTTGDPAGIGPEISLKAAADPEARSLARLVLVGSLALLRRTAASIWPEASAPVLHPVHSPAEVEEPNEVPVIEAGELAAGEAPVGQVSAAAGRAGASAVERAVRMALDGVVDGIVTAPLNKEALRLAGVPYPGHTEMLAALTGAREAGMLLVSGTLRVVHVSVHCSMREAIERVTGENVTRAIGLAVEAARELGFENPRVAVAGLNPHAGEGGLFGQEEAVAIVPAIAAAQATGLAVCGPWPPDTIFLRASRGEFDFVVAMYHDQGHIPVKLSGLETGVNVTLGLPIVRTSVDHGTAFDIAGRGVAQHGNMLEAIRVAARIVATRKAGG